MSPAVTRPGRLSPATALAMALLPGLGIGGTQAASPGGLGGDWGGIRSQLADRGIELSADYTSESATNLSGGEHRRARETGQFTLAATVDTATLIGLEGGTFQATITYRRGEDLGAASELGVLQQVQEVYGRGQTWRLTQFWYEHAFQLGSAPARSRELALKIGRMTVGEDFAAFSCQFQNLTFCGAPPGNIVGDYWYNWPVSQWGARLKLESPLGYIQMAVYEAKPDNLDHEFSLGQLSGGTGVLTPLELAWTPRLGMDRLPGSYKLGGWHDSSDAHDVYLDTDHRAQGLTGNAPLEHSGRYGAYLNFQQQLSGTAAPDGTATSGLTLFFNATRADRHTARVDSQITIGAFVTAPLAGRPDDQLGIAVGRTHVNHRAARTERITGDRAQAAHAEYAAELYYQYQATGWLTLAPNLQFVHHPGGLENETDVVVIGLKARIAL